MRAEAAELAVAGAASKSTYFTGAASAALGFLGSNGFAVFFGVLVTVLTYLTNVYYKSKASRRQEAAEERSRRAEVRREQIHAILIKRLEAGLPVPDGIMAKYDETGPAPLEDDDEK